MHVENGDAHGARASKNLETRVEGNEPPGEETDTPRVERNEVASEPETELEEIRAFEEERALLREKERKACQVDLPLVDLGLGEIRIHGQRRAEPRREVVVEVEAELALREGVARLEVGLVAPERVRADRKPEPLFQTSQSRELSRPAEIRELRVESRPGPSERRAVPRNEPLHVQTPPRGAGREAERLGGNVDLERPSVRRSPCLRLPDAIPVERKLLGPRDEAVHARARRVHAQVVRIPAVEERIEGEGDGVVTVHARVALHRVNGDARRLGIRARDAEIEMTVVDENAHLGPVRMGRARLRCLLEEIRDDPGGSPRGLVEAAVHDDWRGSSRGLDQRGTRRRTGTRDGGRPDGGQGGHDSAHQSESSKPTVWRAEGTLGGTYQLGAASSASHRASHAFISAISV